MQRPTSFVQQSIVFIKTCNEDSVKDRSPQLRQAQCHRLRRQVLTLLLKVDGKMGYLRIILQELEVDEPMVHQRFHATVVHSFMLRIGGKRYFSVLIFDRC